MVALDFATPFLWAGATGGVVGLSWVFRKATTSGIGDIVDAKLRPIFKWMRKHDKAIEELDDRLTDLEHQKRQEQIRIVPPIEEQET